MEGLAPSWVLTVRDWPGEPGNPGSIYDISGLGHFDTLRECKRKAEGFIAGEEFRTRAEESTRVDGDQRPAVRLELYVSEPLDIVYTPGCHFGVLFAEREVARRAAQLWRAVGESQTWGELRQRMPPEDWAQLIDVLTDRDETAPPDCAPFSSEDLPMWGDDGWYLGLWPPEQSVAWFPEDLLEKYDGHTDSANPNRDQLFLPSESAEEIAEELRARGHRVEKTLTGDLPDWLVRIGYRYPPEWSRTTTS